jgi:tetratricopeptide (TPR) repeat protein
MARLKGVGYAERVLASLSADADARALAGHALIQLDEQYDTGMRVLRQALATNVNSITVLSYAGIGALRSCEFEAAETWFMRAIDLNIPDFAGHWMLTGMSQVCVCQQRHDEAIDWGKRALAVAPRSPIALWWLMVALAHSERVGEAKQLRPQLEEALPGCTIARYRRGQTMRIQRYVELMVEGLRLAGVPED